MMPKLELHFKNGLSLFDMFKFAINIADKHIPIEFSTFRLRILFLKDNHVADIVKITNATFESLQSLLTISFFEVAI